MAAAGWIFLPVALLVLEAAGHVSPPDHRGEVETYHVSVGYVFVLRCSVAGGDVDVTWRRGGSLPAGVEVRGGLLFFLPVQADHDGPYTCEKRDKPGTKMTFWVSVSNGKCPDPPERIALPRGVNGGLPCKQEEIFSLNNTRNVRWLKDCSPVEREQNPVSVEENGFLRLPAASESDAGRYTCLVDVSVDGEEYSGARSIQLSIKDGVKGEVFSEPEVVYPQQKVVTVEVGSGTELECLIYIGFWEDSEILTYWTVGSEYPEKYKELKESWRNYSDGDARVYRRSTLYISEVLRQFLNVSFYCHIMSPAERKVGSVRLQEADHSAFHTLVGLCLAASLTVLILVAVFLLFKEDLVLASRELSRHFAKQKAPDGKLYDAYVSFLHRDAPDTAEIFALRILPEKLEQRHGYSLYIRGRDDRPGEAMHDAVAAAVGRCCRLIVILSPDATAAAAPGRPEEEPFCNYRSQICYERKLGLHDALTQNDPKVILLEVGGPVDYSRLPESLRYIKRKQGSLKWTEPSGGAHRLAGMFLNRTFWKKLRFYMPSAPVGRLRAAAEPSAEKMYSYRFLLVIFAAMIPSECSDHPGCADCAVERFNLVEGEAFYFVPKCLGEQDPSGDHVTWHRNNSRMEPISTDKNESVHFHGASLFFLDLRTESSGSYACRYEGASGCHNVYLKIQVFKNRTDQALLYGSIRNSDVNKKVTCPEVVRFTCRTLGGNFTWMKDFKLLHDHSDATLWVRKATKKDEGIYTCACTWTYNRKEYTCSASKGLIYIKQSVHLVPEFIAPASNEQLADEGFPISLNCSVLCGTNVEAHCKASWNVVQTSGYNETTQTVTDSQSEATISTAVLTIEKVTAQDFQTDFECVGEGFYKVLSKTVKLKRRDSVIPLVVRGVCVLLICVSTTLVVKCAATDLALFFRPYFPRKTQNKDKKVYDAYVVFQMQSINKAAEDTLCRFVAVLTSVLEKKCRYQLFIHGRDDLPGEDSVELVVDRIKQSRRLMVILPPGSGSGSNNPEQHLVSPQTSAMGGFACQMGLYHVLVQRDMGVILIQLSHAGPEEYLHLPPGLQHLIRCSAPLRWPEGSRGASAWNSRFWKRVRYLMPATPAGTCPVPDII
ncbi:uncharacterized protein [Brachionichthys hirsutus]|uniref:uncharacterized protein n=1 Tax=Brachionichthys hirsutus TaxID=412623 RepID=UPI003604F356